MIKSKVSMRAHRHEDRGGDPLDGLVNLFDLGIVLSVAFLLAALSSLNLSPDVLAKNENLKQQSAPADAVIVSPNEKVDPIKLREGQKVVGRGRSVGTVYQLSDGRTVIVRDKDQQPGTSQGETPNGASP